MSDSSMGWAQIVGENARAMLRMVSTAAGALLCKP